MRTSRMLLGFLLVALSALMFASLRIDSWLLRLLSLAALSLLELAAAFSMLATFTSLDAEGRLSRKSLAWRYLDWFYGARMPDELHLCRMFWTIVAGATMFLIVVCLAGGAIGGIIYCLITQPKATGMVVGILAAFIGALFLLAWTCVRFAGPAERFFSNNSGVRRTAQGLGLAALILFFAFLIHVIALEHGWSFWGAALRILGVCVGFVVALALICGALAGLVYVFQKGWGLRSAAKRSLLGAFIAAIYERACPVIPVAPENDRAPLTGQ